MTGPSTRRSNPAASRAFPDSIRKHYSAPVCGDGRILPIIESVGRRFIREIDPSSHEGRRLLGEGRVALWSATKGSTPPSPGASRAGRPGVSGTAAPPKRFLPDS